MKELPTTLTLEPITRPSGVVISNLGGGSLFDKYPYENPLVHIPLNDLTLSEDRTIYNIESLRFNNISVDGGYVQMPIYVPGNIGENFTLSGLTKDIQERYYYSICSKEFSYTTEGLMSAAPRKIFMPFIARVKSASDERLLPGEYVMIIVSVSAFQNLNNSVGYTVGGNSVIAVYRLPNKPISRL
jgi:hypothetical protein